MLQALERSGEIFRLVENLYTQAQEDSPLSSARSHSSKDRSNTPPAQDSRDLQEVWEILDRNSKSQEDFSKIIKPRKSFSFLEQQQSKAAKPTSLKNHFLETRLSDCVQEPDLGLLDSSPELDEVDQYFSELSKQVMIDPIANAQHPFPFLPQTRLENEMCKSRKLFNEKARLQVAYEEVEELKRKSEEEVMRMKALLKKKEEEMTLLTKKNLELARLIKLKQ